MNNKPMYDYLIDVVYEGTARTAAEFANHCFEERARITADIAETLKRRQQPVDPADEFMAVSLNGLYRSLKHADEGLISSINLAISYMPDRNQFDNPGYSGPTWL